MLNQLSFGLEDVFINSELQRRPAKAPNYKAENEALRSLGQALADSPDSILRRLAETAMHLCHADSAGISLLEEQDGAEVFRWAAVAGVLSDRLDATMPGDASPCRTTIDSNTTQLMFMAERVFPALKSNPPVVEALFVPFHVEHKPIGTVWVVAHDVHRKFDREDERVIKSLAQFASASWQLLQARASAETAAENQRQQASDLVGANAALQAHIENRTKVEEELQQLNRELQARIAEGALKLTRANGDLVRNRSFDEELRHSETIANMGTLAAGIAHDFNNILHVIQAYAALIMSHSSEPANVFEDAEVIMTTVQEGVLVARQLLAVGRKAEPKFDLADINDVLQRTTRSLSPLFSTATVIVADLDPRVPRIMIDAGLIYQAILNLCLNARDAMPDGGKIFVQTRTTSGAVLRRRLPEASAELYVYIGVADTGDGMTPDVRSRVFESYFTTKKANQGAGLGLSIVRSIVTEHAGFIEVTSEPGCGSTFHIYLPIPDVQAVADDGIHSAALNLIADRPRQRDTVLYAEDEPRLSGLIKRLLEGEGFNVLTARDGAEAVQVHERHKDDITVAILDSGLAKLNGWEAFQRMRKINPKLKGILASGNLSAAAESQLATGELSAVLKKPYAGGEVLATIKRALQHG